MSRIIGGAGKGRRLKSVAGDATRPTGARVRQSLFDILAPVIPGCRFLDAFAGSGGVALEALSRGAAKVVLVDRSAAAIEAARQNVAALAAAGGEALVFKQEARTALRAFAGQGERSTSSSSTRRTTAISTSRSSSSRATACWPKTASGDRRALPQAAASGENRRPRPDAPGARRRSLPELLPSRGLPGGRRRAAG